MASTGSEIGSAYLTIKAKPDASFVSEVGDIGGQAGGLFGGRFGEMLNKMMPAAAIGAAAFAAGKALFDLGSTFDEMTDKIIIGTGASGEALDSLVQSAKNIATTVPTDFETVGDVVQNLNTRLGITGEALEDLSARVIEAGNLLGSEINLDTLTGALNAFGVANEDAAGKMDYLFNVGQHTGIELNQLTKIMESAAPTMQMLGFSFEETANMAGLLDKAGIDAAGTMSKMNKALVELAKPGESAADAYRRVIAEMEHYVSVGDEAAAIDIAETLFGTRGAAQFVGAVQSGALSMEELTDAALGAGDGIMGTMQATMSWQESWQLLQNSIAVALEPLASGIFEAIGNSIAGVTAFVQQNQEAFNTLGQVLGTVAGILINIVGGALTIIGGLITGVGDTVNFLGSVFQNLVNTVTGVFDSVKNIISGAIDFIKNLFHFEFRLPELKLPHIVVGEYIDVPVLGRIPNPLTLHVEWYKQGGIIDGPSLIGAGEAGPEAIVPLSNPYMAPFADAIADRMEGNGDTFVFNITADSETTLQRLVREAQQARRLYA